MCDGDSREYNRKLKNVPTGELPHVKVEMPLTEMNGMYARLVDAERVLREGNPEKKQAIVQDILAGLRTQMNDACCGFLAARN